MLPIREVSTEEAERLIWSSWSEDQLLGYVRTTAKAAGWMCYHTRFSLKSEAGYPDVCLVQKETGRLLFAELKRQGKWPTEGHLSRGAIPRWVVGQREWLEALAATDAEVYLLWPSDCHDIATILLHGPDPEMECVQRIRRYLGGVAQ